MFISVGFEEELVCVLYEDPTTIELLKSTGLLNFPFRVQKHPANTKGRHLRHEMQTFTLPSSTDCLLPTPTFLFKSKYFASPSRTLSTLPKFIA